METWSAFSFWEIPHFVRDFGRRAPARQSAARSRLLNARCEASVAFSFCDECGAGALAREGCLRVGTQGSPTTSDNLPASEPTLPLPDSVGCIRISPSNSHPTATHDRRIPLPRPDRKCEAAY